MTLNLTIFLYGPPGSGKSTVGRILAERLAIPFTDLDSAVETRAGRAIPEIFSAEGESRFRAWERETLAEILSEGERVIALGGGALTDSSTRALIEGRGRVLLLHAPPDVLLKRLRHDAAERPLLRGDAAARLLRLLARRADHYASFPLQLETAEKTPDEVAWEAQVLLGAFRLRGMESRRHPPCDVRVLPGGLDSLGEMMTSRGLHGPIAVVTDENVAAWYLPRVLDSLRGSGLEAHPLVLPSGEAHKTPQTVARLWEAFVSFGVERRSTVLALGGGVVSDLTGFAAATFLRGVPWVVAPTSLLAMVDASLGGKTGTDLPQGKNLIGAFHPPRLVLADPLTLRTLPRAEFVNGMAEVIKHAIIGGDPTLRSAAASRSPEILHLIPRAMAVKIRLIEEDPYEGGARAALNLGHTVGHGVELASRFRIRHGEAVAIGMVSEARLAAHIGLAAPELAEEIAALLRPLGLPTEIPADLETKAVISAMRRDKKKTSGEVRFSLPAAFGDVRVGVAVPGWERLLAALPRSVNLSPSTEVIP